MPFILMLVNGVDRNIQLENVSSAFRVVARQGYTDLDLARLPALRETAKAVGATYHVRSRLSLFFAKTFAKLGPR